ncbi:MAG: sulfotransferase [Actinobacteria bacterium]|nr:sulfotransferase [Actinomycetota bacterium]
MNVLFVVGPGRSGSTILANVIGEMPGVFAAGEVRWLFRRGMMERRLCGCGHPPADCDVWGPVIRDVSAVAPADEIVSWQHEVASLSRRWRLLRGTDDTDVLDRYAAAMRTVYGSLVRTTGADWIVDSSKRPQDLAVALRGAGRDRVAVVHLVRDPRAVAASWSRTKAQPDRPEGGRMRRNPPLKSALRWVEINLGAEVLRRARAPLAWTTVRYEDLIADPRSVFGKVADLMGLDRDGLPFTGDRTVALGPNHTVAGNPDRFNRGEVEIHRDAGRSEGLPASHRAVVSAITAPFARRYDYPPRP